MSVLSRKRVAEAEGEETRERMQQLAWATVLVRAAVPRAKTAGMAARDGVRTAAQWTAPRINQARAWTAPRIEQSGLAFKDTIAPKVYETLMAAARYVDVAAAGPGSHCAPAALATGCGRNGRAGGRRCGCGRRAPPPDE